MPSVLWQLSSLGQYINGPVSLLCVIDRYITSSKINLNYQLLIFGIASNPLIVIRLNYIFLSRFIAMASREYPPLSFDDAKKKGLEFWLGLQAALRDPSHHDNDTSDTYDKYYESKSMGFQLQTEDNLGLMKLKWLFEQKLDLVYGENINQVLVNQKGYSKTIYNNHFGNVPASDHPKGVIIAAENNNKEDHSQDHKLHWSDAAFEGYKGTVGPGNVHYLAWIIRFSVNDEAKSIINDVRKKLLATENDYLTVKPETDEFFALLGTRNGRGAAFLLKDHCKEIGQNKSIRSIQVPATSANYETKEKGGPYILIFEIA